MNARLTSLCGMGYFFTGLRALVAATKRFFRPDHLAESLRDGHKEGPSPMRG